MANRKGQINSVDAVLSSIVLVILVVSVLSLLFNNFSSAETAAKRAALEYSAISLSDTLLKQRGSPHNWERNPTQAETIGLVTNENVLSERKLSNFTNFSYETLKDKLNINSEFYFYVEQQNGSRIYATGNSSLGGTTVVSITRIAMLNNEKVRVRLHLYE